MNTSDLLASGPYPPHLPDATCGIGGRSIEAGKKWCAAAFGVEPYFDQPFYVGFAVGGFELGLVPDAAPGDAGAQPLWGVDDIESEVIRLLSLGAAPIDPVVEVVDGIKVAAVRDPFGNRLGLIENPHFRAADVR